MNAYGAFAHTYDRMMHDVDYDAWAAYLISILRENGVRTILECGCGTGQITIRLAKAGFSMIGSDISEEMLMEARTNALQAGLRTLPFVRESMTELSVHRQVDAVLSACDGVNYLTEPGEAELFFQSAAHCVKAGGLLLFDVSSAYKLERVLGNETFTEVTDDYAYIWENAFDAETRLCEMDLTFFVRDGAAYRRFSEQHVQRAHEADALIEAMQRAGFDVIGVWDAFSRNPARPESERIQFLAKKI